MSTDLVPRGGHVVERGEALDGEYIPARDRAEKINVQDFADRVRIDFSIILRYPSSAANFLAHCYQNYEKTPKGYFAELGVTHQCMVTRIDITYGPFSGHIYDIATFDLTLLKTE